VPADEIPNKATAGLTAKLVFCGSCWLFHNSNPKQSYGRSHSTTCFLWFMLIIS